MSTFERFCVWTELWLRSSLVASVVAVTEFYPSVAVRKPPDENTSPLRARPMLRYKACFSPTPWLSFCCVLVAFRVFLCWRIFGSIEPAWLCAIDEYPRLSSGVGYLMLESGTSIRCLEVVVVPMRFAIKAAFDSRSSREGSSLRVRLYCVRGIWLLWNTNGSVRSYLGVISAAGPSCGVLLDRLLLSCSIWDLKWVSMLLSRACCMIEPIVGGKAI